MQFGALEAVLYAYLVALSKGDCPGGPTVLAQDVYSYNGFLASNVVSPSCGESSYWTGPDGQNNVGFTLEYGKVYHSDGFYLRNDPNRRFRDRSTVTFKIEYSLDNIDWNTAIEGSFSGPIPPTHPCEQTEFFAVSENPIQFKYLKFVALTHYRHGATLSFFAPRVLECNDISIIMDHSSYPRETKFSALGLLDEDCSHTDWTNNHHWRGSQSSFTGNGRTSGYGFIMDLGKITGLWGFQLKNDKDAPRNSRATKDFEVLASKDLANWTKVVEGTLADVTTTSECDDTIFIATAKNTWTRYVRFRDKSHYRDGPALAYFAPVAPELDCKIYGKSYATTPIAEVSVPHEQDCKQLCDNNVQCVGSSFIPSSQNCKSFGQDALYSDLVDSADSISLPKYCS